jgi:hypothetical protein
MSLRIRRGTESQRQTTTFDLGEIAYTTDSKKLFVGDGVTVGGVNVLKTTAGAGLSWNDSTQQLDISGTNLSTSNITEGTNLYFTTDRAQDASASLFTHNVGHSNISFTYDDTLNKILATVSLDGVGIASVSADTSPALGGNLNLSTHQISGTGNIDITGNITATTLNGKLGSDLDLNTHNISGTGNITIDGAFGNQKIKYVAADAICVDGIRVFCDKRKILTLSGITGITRNKSMQLIFQSSNGSNFNNGLWYGTQSGRTSSIPGDSLGSIVFAGYNASDQSTNTAAVISTRLSTSIAPGEDPGDPSLTWPKGTLSFMVGTNSMADDDDDELGCAIMTLDHRGVFQAPIVKIGSYESISLPSHPEKGWMVFDSTTNQFKGWNGTSWVILG